ncbi:hypothetical protein B566_EDAN002728 [Ephemera danica]|nr:hypothetical protein B566_EDAN002728 [Ephemera danica]
MHTTKNVNGSHTFIIMRFLTFPHFQKCFSASTSSIYCKTIFSKSKVKKSSCGSNLRGVATAKTLLNSNTVMDYNRFLNATALRRQVSPIRELTKLFATAKPGTIFLGSGIPNAGTFPFGKVVIELKDGVSFSLDGKTLENALQYQPTPGYIPLVQQLKELQQKVHGLRSNFWDTNDLVVTTGSQDGLCKAIEMSLEDGEPILVQEPIYSGTTAILKAFDPRMIAVAQDSWGVCPEKLEEALKLEGTAEEIRARQKGVPKVRIWGVTIPTERKKRIYEIACEYDLIILEDDPYYYLHFEEKEPVSFLSLDTQGRVLRLDSFSKILSSGLRLGFVTGPKALVNRIELHMQASVMHASSLPQVLVSNLLKEWGHEKLFNHFKYIQKFYKLKRDSMVAAAEKHLTGLADWTVPTAGMFLWFKVRGIQDVKKMGFARLATLIKEELQKQN